MTPPLVHRNECAFPGCTLEPNASGEANCLLHKNVKIDPSYLNKTEVRDE
jgi:hypothetical protein